MNYEIVNFSDYSGIETSMVNVFLDDGSVESFPADAENPRYKQFLIDIGEAEPKLPEAPVAETPVEEAPVEETPVDVATEKENI